MGATGECAPPPQYNTAKPKTGGLSAHADDPGAKDLAARQRHTLPSKMALRVERRPSVPLDAPFCNSSEVGSKSTILIFCDVANGFLPPLKPAQSFSFGFGGSLKTILSFRLGGCGGSNHKMRPITRDRLAFEAGVSRFSFAARPGVARTRSIWVHPQMARDLRTSDAANPQYALGRNCGTCRIWAGQLVPCRLHERCRSAAESMEVTGKRKKNVERTAR